MKTRVSDICVIGSGAGGGPVARVLAEAGHQVIVVDRGRDPEASEFEQADEDKHAMADGAWFPSQEKDPYLTALSDGSFMPTNDGKAPHSVGGSMNFWGASCTRFKPIDFEIASRYPVPDESSACDWPIKYDDLAYHYARAEQEFGVGGVKDSNPFAPPGDSDVLLGQLHMHPMGNVIADAARKMGLNPFPTRMAILQDGHEGRGPCWHKGLCAGYGCPSEAKGSTRNTVLKAAKKTGRCDVLAGLRASKLVTDPQNPSRVTACELLDADGKAALLIKAKTFVVACRAIESARLLLCSAGKGHPKGLANSSGLVGKNLMFGLTLRAKGYFIREKHPQWAKQLKAREPFCQVSLHDYYEKITGSERQAFNKGGVISFYGPGNSAFGQANDVLYEQLSPGQKRGKIFWGEGLRERLIKLIRDAHQMEFEIFTEYLPMEDVFVRLHKDRKDHHGIPCIELHHGLHRDSYNQAVRLGQKGMDIFEKMGADHIQTSLPFRNTALTYGTCRFGKDPKRSVLDPNCAAHDVPNLFVTDGSFMPTSGGAPGTLTILANSYRVGEHIHKHWDKFRGGE